MRLKALLVEDSELDAALVLRDLTKADFDVTSTRVDTPEDMAAALAGTDWDVITCDYSMPRFSGPAALKLAQSQGFDGPLIVVSGTVGEDAAVEMMKAGADDYLMKSSLSRLGPAVTRGLREAEERRRGREAGERHRHLFESLNDAAFLADATTGEILETNDQGGQLLGRAVDEIVGMHQVELHPPDQADECRRMFATSVREGHGSPFDADVIRKDGTVVPVAISASTVTIDGRELILGLFRDVTDAKRAEDALRQSEERLALALSSSELGTWDWNVQTGDVLYDERWCSMLGYARDELEPNVSTWDALLHPDDRPGALADVAAHHAGRTPVYETEFRLKTKSNDWRHILARGKVTDRTDGGEPIRMIGVHLDITEHRALEATIRQTSKLEAIGTLAGGVAHDFNNILTGIIGYAEVIQDEGLVVSEGTRELATIRELADRAANLTRQLLAFSRRQPIETKILNPNELIHELTKLLGRVIGEDVEVKLQLAEGLHRISADSGQVDQVIMNLAVNGRDAMPTGGTLIIETANVELDQEYADGHTGVTPGAHVMLAVSDTGCGMDAETRERIFEPFFTTKEVGSGTGLGLATVYGIVKQHGGHIWVYSELGKGTTFKIYLPSTSGEVDRTVAVASASAEAAPGETVLLVEDDPTVREIAQRALASRGYTVLAASHAGEAERLSAAYDDKIALLLSDVVMPG